MMKINAEEFSMAGEKYLGRNYEEMDCQAFVEKCMADVGLHMDLGGSNSWYREVMKHGWVGSPEECVKRFGSVPKGALLFILEPVSAGTPGKFRVDGIGDATHMGIVTGRGEGAIHSSSSRGCVATSKFRGKTIPNGGWNQVGLYDKFDYGKEQISRQEAVTKETEDHGQGTEKEGSMMKVMIRAENGGAVKLRQGRDPKRKEYGIWEEIPSGTEAEVLQGGEAWSKIRVGKKTGWMMSKFLIADGSGIPSEPELAEDNREEGIFGTDEDGGEDGDGRERVALFFDAEELAMLLPVLESAAEQIIQKVGRG